MPREDITHHELTDEDLTRMIVDTMAWRKDMHFPHVRVDVDEGIVRLSGHVECYDEKSAAEDAANQVPGVTQVINDIVVAPPISADSAHIQQNIAKTLKEDVRLSSDDFEISVTGGTAEIRGEVVTEGEKMAALDDVQGTYGVVNVVDQISVIPEKSSSDHMLEEIVNATILRTGNIHGRNIQAHVVDSIAHLTGSTPSAKQKEEIERVVSGIPGVEAVQSDITIELPQGG